MVVKGGPGSGKKTVCRKLEEEGFKSISMRTILQAEVDANTEAGGKIKEAMEGNNLAPLNVVIQCLKDCLIKEAQTQKYFAIHGFPKDIDQVTKFEKEIAAVEMGIYLKVSDEVMKARCIEAIQASGGAPDANTIDSKVELFKTKQTKVLDYYAKKKKICEIDAASPVDVVWQNVQKCVKKK